MNAAVPLEDLPLVEQARHLRRVDPDRAVAFDLVPDSVPLARMFYDGSGRPARGLDALDPATRGALYQQAEMIHDFFLRPAVGR